MAERNRNGNNVSVTGVADGGRGGESVVAPPTHELAPYAPFVFQMASVADDITPWGQSPALRDAQLRSFWPTESFLASAIYSIVARNSAFSWTLDGPPRTVARVQDMLQMADDGNGWQQFILKVTTDLLTQDNGAFIEIIRATPSETAAVVGLAHLDAARCRRTGVPEFPVVYSDRFGVQHKLRPWQVIAWAEFPSPVETMNGVGLCAVSRVLRMAQLMRDISIYQREKVAGRNPSAIWLVSGVSTRMIDDAIAANGISRDAQGALRFMLPLVIGSLDPTATVDATKIDLASLPDNFDLEVTLKWYITQLALGFGADYQDFAPMSLGGLGSSAQSLVLHMKSRGKGPALFMKALEYWFNFHGVVPRNVTFKYDEQDLAADMEQAELRKLRAEARKIDIETGVLTPAAGRQQMLDDGDLSPEVFDALQTEPDLTEDVTVPDNDRDELQEPEPGTPTLPAPVPPTVGQAAINGAEKALSNRFVWQWTHAGQIERALLTAFRPLQKDVGEWVEAAPSPRWSALAPEIRSILEDPLRWESLRTDLRRAAVSAARGVAGPAAEAAAKALTLPDGDGDRVALWLLPLVDAYAEAWAVEILDSTKAAVTSAYAGWEAAGLGADGLPELLAALSPWFSGERAERLALTEVTRLIDIGTHALHEQNGIVLERWELGHTELSGPGGAVVCPVCASVAGTTFALDAGPRPPLHAGCTCLRTGLGV